MVLGDYERRGCLYKNACLTIKSVLFQPWTAISSTNRSQSFLPRLTSEGGMFAIIYCILYPIISNGRDKLKAQTMRVEEKWPIKEVDIQRK